MPNIDLTIRQPVNISPRGAYIRVAKVLRSSLDSLTIDIEFLDGLGTEVVTAQVMVVAKDPDTTYMMSGVLFGRGDRVVVLVQGGDHYVVSALDQYSNQADTNELSNRSSYALAKNWLVLDVFNRMIVEINRDGASSYVDFYDPVAGIVRVTGDTNKKNVLARILDPRHGAPFETSTTHMGDDFNFGSMYCIGPAQTTPRLINSKICHGRFVNHIEAVHDMPFADPEMNATLSMYDPDVTDITTAEINPSCAGPDYKWYEPAVIWSDTDSNPEYVLCICCYPAYTVADPTMMEVKFVEVPVYALAERKLLDLDENGKVVHAWQKYGDDIRVIDTIDRSYIDISAFNFSGCSSSLDQMHQAPVITASGAGNNVADFCVYEGYGWVQDNQVFDAHRLRKTIGTVTRTGDPDGPAVAANGSPFTYAVSNTNPATVLNYTHVNVHYFNDNAGTVYEDHVTDDPLEEYLIMEQGANTLTRRILIDYHADGIYDALGVSGYSWSSNPGGSEPEGLDGCLNTVDYEFLYNDSLIFTDSFRFEFNVNYYLNHSYSNFLYVNLEIGLFIFDRTIIDVEGPFGPGGSCTGIRTRKAVVSFQGAEYIIWEFVETMTTFPTVWNFFPWVVDSNYPQRPDPAPYDESTTPYTSVWFYPPFGEYYVDMKSDVFTEAKGYPCPYNDATSIVFVSVRDWDTDNVSDYFQVNVLGNSWRVKCECFLDDSPANITLTYPNGGDTLYRLNGAVPTFTKPVVNSTLSV